MKRFTCLLLAAAGFSLVSNAQITKGSTFLGGSFGAYSSSSEDDNNQTQKTKGNGWTLYPQIGKAISNNKIVGLRFGYGRSKQENQYNSQKSIQESSTFSGGIFYRRYYPLSNRFYLFGEVGTDFSASKREVKNNDILDARISAKEVSFDITPGISFAASRKLHLEASLNQIASLYYQWSKTDNNPQFPTGPQSLISTQKSFGLAGNGNGFSNITIGLRWILPGKAK